MFWFCYCFNCRLKLINLCEQTKWMIKLRISLMNFTKCIENSFVRELNWQKSVFNIRFIYKHGSYTTTHSLICYFVYCLSCRVIRMCFVNFQTRWDDVPSIFNLFDLCLDAGIRICVAVLFSFSIEGSMNVIFIFLWLNFIAKLLEISSLLRELLYHSALYVTRLRV